MTAQPRSALYNYFNTGDKPSEAEFANLIDSFPSILGDTMQGDLVLNANPTVALGAATKQYVDSAATSPTFTGSVAINGGTVVASAPALSVTQTWNNAGTTFSGVDINITSTASNVASTIFAVRLAGANRFSVTRDGGLNIVGNINASQGSFILTGGGVTIPAGSLYEWSGRSNISSPADGRILLANNAFSDFSRLMFGGTSASFPAIRRTTTALNFRLADDSADCAITAATAAPGTNTTQVATTAFVTAAIAVHPILTSITASLGADVNLNNTSNYFDGPSVAQGSTGTWLANGTVTITDTGGAAGCVAKLWDGTTVIASCAFEVRATNINTSVSLSGRIASPAGNLRISVRDVSNTTGVMKFNASANSMDSTITAVRIA